MEEFEAWAAYYADFLDPDENPKEPMSIFYFPVFDTDLESLEVEDAASENVGKSSQVIIEKQA